MPRPYEFAVRYQIPSRSLPKRTGASRESAKADFVPL